MLGLTLIMQLESGVHPWANIIMTSVWIKVDSPEIDLVSRPGSRGWSQSHPNMCTEYGQYDFSRKTEVFLLVVGGR